MGVKLYQVSNECKNILGFKWELKIIGFKWV